VRLPLGGQSARNPGHRPVALKSLISA